jgi:hypothetical protein
LLKWAVGLAGERLWAIEDCRHLTRRLERDLIAAGESVVRVSPKLMAHVRDSARSYGKSDPIDALAVARAALREPNLPIARLDGVEREIRLLVDHREDLRRGRATRCSADNCANASAISSRTMAAFTGSCPARSALAASPVLPLARNRSRSLHPGSARFVGGVGEEAA